MKSSRLDAQDNLLAWMKFVNKRINRLERKGRIDLLSGTVETAMAGELTVRTLDDIPTDIPFGSLVYVIEQEVVLVQDAVTREWQAVV